MQFNIQKIMLFFEKSFLFQITSQWQSPKRSTKKTKGLQKLGLSIAEHDKLLKRVDFEKASQGQRIHKQGDLSPNKCIWTKDTKRIGLFFAYSILSPFLGTKQKERKNV